MTSSPSRLRRKTENSRYVAAMLVHNEIGASMVIYEMSDVLTMLLICVESDKILLLHKL